MEENQVIVDLTDYPKFMKEWLNSNYSIEQTLKNYGINSALKLPSLLVTANLRLRYGMNKPDYTWFVLRWS